MESQDRDAGSNEQDAGAQIDGGALPTDGGSLPTDGGSLPTDGGSLPMDGGTPPNDGGSAETLPDCPSTDSYASREIWRWSGRTLAPESRNVLMTPLVVQLTDDDGDGAITARDTPDVVFTTCKPAECCIGCNNSNDLAGMDLSGKGLVRAIDGATGADLWATSAAVVTATTQLAAADLEGDGAVEIVAVKHHFVRGSGPGGMQGKYATGKLLVFDRFGALRHETDAWTGSADDLEQNGAPTVGDMDGDGSAEILFAATVFNANGRKRFDLSGGSGSDGHGAFPAFVDVDSDSKPEILVGNAAYRSDGTLRWSSGKPRGPFVVADLGADNTAEIVLRTGIDSLVVLDAATGAQKGGDWTLPLRAEVTEELSICPAPMAAADVTGDGKPEVLVPAGARLYALRDDGSVLWRAPIADYQGQCGAAGVVAFDFDGDGRREAVYADTTRVRIFRGLDGAVLFEAPRAGTTLFETPVVADVDGDGRADLLVAEDGAAAGGLVLFSSVGNVWPRTRGLWNQHAYRPADVLDSQRVAPPGPGWKTDRGWRLQHGACRR